jgi:hypothetical protein
MDNEQVIQRLNVGDLGLVADIYADGLTNPQKIRLPQLARYLVQPFPGAFAEPRLPPGASRQTGNAEIRSCYDLRRPQLTHAGECQPWSFKTFGIPVEHAQIGYSFAQKPEGNRYSALAAADDYDVMHGHAVSAARNHPLSRRVPETVQFKTNAPLQLGEIEICLFRRNHELPRLRSDSPFDRKRLPRHRLGKGNDMRFQSAGQGPR